MIESYLSTPGHCEKCQAGTFSVTSVDVWVETCDPCPAGTFAPTEGSAQCFQCEVNQFAGNEGLSQCTSCPTGKYTNGHRGSHQCKTCDAMYVGSPNCTVPVMGIIVGLTSVIVILVVTYFVRRKFEYDRKVKQKLRAELLRQRTSRDISLVQFHTLTYHTKKRVPLKQRLKKNRCTCQGEDD